MNSPLHNSKDTNSQDDHEPSLASLISPLRIELSQTAEGWCVDISSLSPCDAMMALAQDDMLEDSTILCGDGTTQWVACIHGPVELGDAKAIVQEVSGSSSPLRADLRMQSVVTSNNTNGVSAHVRDYDDALVLVATAMMQYASELLGEPVSPPELGLVDRLLERTGRISIRPIETEIFSSFVDIGISTSSPTSRADTATIYDIHSDSWHGQ